MPIILRFCEYVEEIADHGNVGNGLVIMEGGCGSPLEESVEARSARGESGEACAAEGEDGV
eukprot:6172586-Lingulodinium_polyedra.AAC.1